MQQIQEIIIGGSMSILTILAGIAVKAVKDFLVAKGGEKAIKITEILAKNAVNATEQVAQKLDIHGEQKLAHAKDIVKKGLEQYNIYLTNSQIDNFIEAAVKQANEAWKGN
ncbi:TPA: phage holin [Streptococcus pyogenes]|nr:MAG: holin [Bacteriophage sp.]HEP4476157.1 phage holin [Streptococcus pyogenes]HEP5229929.1 phage holin [Streptococcus pyogenes]HER9302625.1 phage holin [Streptococcus pyogenes]HES3505101.1 phage holin [Streptococcus pyogenes]